MEHFFNVIKVFIEKHLIPTLTSVVLTVVSILLFPALSLIQNKTGLALFWLFIFCCWFLIIHFTIWIVKTIKARIILIKQSEEQKEKEIAKVNVFYDDLTPSDKAIINSFLSKRNLPLRTFIHDFFDDSILWTNNSIFYITPSPVGMEEGTYWVLPNTATQYSSSSSFETDGSYLYKLKDAEYNELSFVYSKQGKLGNF